MENKMTPFSQIPHLQYEEGLIYSKCTALWEQLSESRKSLIAKLACKEEGSEAQRDRLARSKDEFKQYLMAVQIARQNMLNSKAMIDKYKGEFEYYRSMNANKRAEMIIR